MSQILTVARYTVIGVFVLGAGVAFGSWLVRSRRISPFTRFGRFLRSATDPVMRPVESRVVRFGGNPVNAGWWLVIGLAVLGVVALSLIAWILVSAQRTYWAFSGGPREIARFVVQAIYALLILAIIIRVIGSWLGMFAYARWTRPAYLLTDWLVNPIRRVLPAFGMFDLSPLVAWLVLWLLKSFVLLLLA